MSNGFSYNGFQIPAVQVSDYKYTPVIVHGGVAWVSGSVPKTGDVDLYPGKVGSEVTIEQAGEAAQLALLNGLSSLANVIDGLDNVAQMLKMTVFVTSSSGFVHQPKVADFASRLLLDIFARRGTHARSAIGVAELPRNSSVEIELIAAIK